jgi:hypothetical protein
VPVGGGARPALLCLGHLASSARAWQFVDEGRLLEAMVAAALGIDSYVARGTLLAALALVSPTPRRPPPRARIPPARDRRQMLRRATRHSRNGNPGRPGAAPATVGGRRNVAALLSPITRPSATRELAATPID